MSTAPIWDEVYPRVCFPDDIAHGRLYVAEEDGALVSAFALCDFHPGAEAVGWRHGRGRALYLDRLGVRVEAQGRGLGGKTLRMAMALARERGAASLRLFAVDVNAPAIGLYRKSGFRQAEGVYLERIDDDLVLRELGFEIALAGAT